MGRNPVVLIGQLGPQLGYLPQDIELFDGTVAENIARFGDVNADLVIQAARDAGVHELILALPEGYDTVITGQKGLLSHGQRQRLILARALYGRPKILVLDEPNSNLDEAGEQALNRALAEMKSLKTTIIMVSHQQAVLALADYVLILQNGVIREQGPRDLVVARFKAQEQQKKPWRQLSILWGEVPMREAKQFWGICENFIGSNTGIHKQL